jgi:hypothetical protein
VETWRKTQITDDTAKLIFYTAFVDGKLEAPRSLLPEVHRLYFEPQYPEFSARTMWSNAELRMAALVEKDLSALVALAHNFRMPRHQRFSGPEKGLLKSAYRLVIPGLPSGKPTLSSSNGDCLAHNPRPIMNRPSGQMAGTGVTTASLTRAASGSNG